jgi:hypothetical protein
MGRNFLKLFVHGRDIFANGTLQILPGRVPQMIRVLLGSLALIRITARRPDRRGSSSSLP